MSDLIVDALHAVREINTRYDLSVESVDKTAETYQKAFVTTPVIGKFSSGKSALLNTLLGYTKAKKMLQEDITPETAVPTEIVYTDGDENVDVYAPNGDCDSMKPSIYRGFKGDAKTVSFTRLHLKNGFLEKIPHVVLVDMPGFASGYEIHNKAIDNYLPQSLAYILAIPVDDMIIRSDVGNILKELCHHDMPIGVAITKYDKRNQEEFDEQFNYLKKQLKKYMGDRDLTYCITSSYTGDAEEVEDFLQHIEEEAPLLLIHRYTPEVLNHLNNTEGYLKNALNSSQMSESELQEKEERQKQELMRMETKFGEEQSGFDKETTRCVEQITGDVGMALESDVSTMISLVLNRSNLESYVNTLIRNAVNKSVKQRFVPQMDRYLKRVGNVLDGEKMGDVHISFTYNVKDISNGISTTAVAASAAAIGLIFGGPIGALLWGLQAAIVNKIKDVLFGNADEEREKQKQEIRQKLQSEVFPQIMSQVGANIEAVLMRQMGIINTSVEEELKKQKETLQKAIEDTRKKMTEEKAEKEKSEAQMKADLEQIRVLKANLGETGA